MWLLNLKNTLPSIRKKPHGIILREESKEQHLSIVLKSCSYEIINHKNIELYVNENIIIYFLANLF